VSVAAYDDDLRKRSVARCTLALEMTDRMRANGKPLSDSDVRSLAPSKSVACCVRWQAALYRVLIASAA
jgi:hypothetical protein